MRRSLLAIVLGSAFLAFVPPAAAERVCIDGLCLEIDPLGDDCSGRGDCEPRRCPSTHDIVSNHPWYYRLGDGTIRDPLLDSTFYLATWSYSRFYEPDGAGGCREVAYSCRVQVSDGSHFQYLRVGAASAANGEYKGIPTSGGTLDCGPDRAELHTYAAFVVAVHGYSYP